MKSIKVFLLPAILAFYALLYLATKKVVPCDGDCEKMLILDTTLSKNRSYIWYVGRCQSGIINDTICIGALDSSGINWGGLADTTCQLAQQIGLTNQTIVIINTSISPHDTFAIKHCP